MVLPGGLADGAAGSVCGVGAVASPGSGGIRGGPSGGAFGSGGPGGPGGSASPFSLVIGVASPSSKGIGGGCGIGASPVSCFDGRYLASGRYTGVISMGSSLRGSEGIGLLPMDIGFGIM